MSLLRKKKMIKRSKRNKLYSNKNWTKNSLDSRRMTLGMNCTNLSLTRKIWLRRTSKGWLGEKGGELEREPNWGKRGLLESPNPLRSGRLTGKELISGWRARHWTGTMTTLIESMNSSCFKNKFNLDLNSWLSIRITKIFRMCLWGLPPWECF